MITTNNVPLDFLSAAKLKILVNKIILANLFDIIFCKIREITDYC